MFHEIPQSLGILEPIKSKLHEIISKNKETSDHVCLEIQKMIKEAIKIITPKHGPPSICVIGNGPIGHRISTDLGIKTTSREDALNAFDKSNDAKIIVLACPEDGIRVIAKSIRVQWYGLHLLPPLIISACSTLKKVTLESLFPLHCSCTVLQPHDIVTVATKYSK